MTLNKKCVCGAISKPLGVYDYDYSYVICSDACKSILSTRVSWSKEYGYDYMNGVSA
jgi:hypothetical protein